MLHFTAAGQSSLGDDLIVAVVSAVLTAVLVFLVGYRVAYYWEERKRLRESDLAAVETFYRLYGDFFATWKRWDSHMRHGVNRNAHREVQWELLSRAEAAEGGYEALLVKLASERHLSPKDQTLLGCFREAYQMLRESIRADKRLQWWASEGHSDRGIGHDQYRAYKALAEYIALMLEGRRPAKRFRPNEARAIRSLLAITNPREYRGRWWIIAQCELKLADISQERERGAAL